MSKMPKISCVGSVTGQNPNCMQLSKTLWIFWEKKERKIKLKYGAGFFREYIFHPHWQFYVGKTGNLQLYAICNK